MTDKTKTIFALILVAAFALALVLAGCSVNPKDDLFKTAKPENYQLIPAPLDLPIPAIEPDTQPANPPKKGDHLCLL